MTWQELCAAVEADGITAETVLEKVEWGGTGTEVRVTTKQNALGEVGILARVYDPVEPEEDIASS